MRIKTSIRRIAAAGAVLVLGAGWLWPSSAAGPSVATTAIDGQAVAAGDTVRVKRNTFAASGTADATPPLAADAGDSAYVRADTLSSLLASVSGGTEPYAFAWSFAGATDRFADPHAFETTFDTSGLAGKATVDLTVTDAAGETARDTVSVFVWSPVTRNVLDETVDAAPGIPDEGQSGVGASGAIDGETRSFPFAIVPNTLSLELTLSWNEHQEIGEPTGTIGTIVGVNDFDMYVDDPSDTHDEEASGATAAMPERISVDSPAPGDWSARVAAFLNGPDTYVLQGTAVEAQANPIPEITAGPFSFDIGQGQVLTAEVAGGTEPYEITWDFDRDGVADAAGATAVSDLPVGTNLVTVKVTDGAGYEKRTVTPVRVGVTASNGSPVVVAVADTGLNVYHRDFRATTYKDATMLERTAGFTAHPSQYVAGYPTNAAAKNITLDRPFATGKLHPAEDAALWTKESTPVGKLFWIPGTKIIGAIDGSDTAAVNSSGDATPILDDDGHGTASASVAVGNLYGHCPQCLLFFGEGLSSDELLATYPFVDLISVSGGTPANVGVPRLMAPAQPKENAEAGQIALYAAGNGNENAFVTPEQTYTSASLGPDWLVRVGAVEKGTRKPIIGTGKPVDIASWGLGASSGPDSMPAAAPDSPSGTVTHSGTSAATPYSAGVFGTVLAAVRDALGDIDAGQKNPANTRAGIVAKGKPISGSPYLADGILTRTELVNAVFKTAEHDGGSTSAVYPPTTPAAFPAQYLIEGYGIVEPASALRAIDVLMGNRPMPDRPAEDDFFEADSQLRDALWGGWAGGGEDSSAETALQSTPNTANPFDGITTAALPTFDAAWTLLSERAGPFQNDVLADAAAAAAAGGITYWPHAVGDCNAQSVDEFLDTTNSAGDVECTTTGTTGVFAGDVATWTTKTPLTSAIPAGTAVDGVLYLATVVPTNTIVTVTASAAGRTLGQSETEVVTLGALDDYAGVPVEFTTTDGAAIGEDLTVTVTMDLSPTWAFGFEDDHASFFTFAVTDTGGGGGEPGTLGATITSPVAGTVIDPAATPTVAVTGTATFPAVATPSTTARFYPFWDETEAGDCGTQRLLTEPGVADSGCVQTFQALAPTGIVEFVESYPAPVESLPMTVADGGTVSGVVTYGAALPDPAHGVTVRLMGTPAGAALPVVLGEQAVEGMVIGVLGAGETTAFPFSFAVGGEAAGVPLEGLSLDVRTDSSTLAYMDRENGASYVDVPLATAPPGGSGEVQVSIDDPTFSNAGVATLAGDGAWGYTLDVLALDGGAHTIYARAVQGTATSSPASVGITIERAAPTERVLVQLQLVPEGGGESSSAWMNATATSAGFATWTARPTVSRGTHTLLARLLVDGTDVARAGSVTIVKRRS